MSSPAGRSSGRIRRRSTTAITVSASPGELTEAFDMHVSVGGFCTFVRDASSASRTQRAIMRIAKRESC